jgi:hypothetical protein
MTPPGMLHLVLSLLLSVSFVIQPRLADATPTSTLQSNLTSNVEFSPNDTVLVLKDVVIPSGVTVKFGSGVRVLLAAGANIFVSSGAKLVAVGTRENPVVFTSSIAANSIPSVSQQNNLDGLADNTMVRTYIY